MSSNMPLLRAEEDQSIITEDVSNPNREHDETTATDVTATACNHSVINIQNKSWSFDSKTTPVIDPPTMFLPDENHPQVSLDQSGNNLCEYSDSFPKDDESLFYDLMSKSSVSDSALKTSSPSPALLDYQENKVLQTLLHNSQESVSDTDVSSVTSLQLEPPAQFSASNFEEHHVVSDVLVPSPAFMSDKLRPLASEEVFFSTSTTSPKLSSQNVSTESISTPSSSPDDEICWERKENLSSYTATEDLLLSSGPKGILEAEPTVISLISPIANIPKETINSNGMYSEFQENDPEKGCGVAKKSHRHKMDLPVSPTNNEKLISSKKSTKVVRSHSYSSQQRNKIIHQREGSRSSCNSPEVGPIAKASIRSTIFSKVKRHASLNRGSSTAGAINNPRKSSNLEESCIAVGQQSMITEQERQMPSTQHLSTPDQCSETNSFYSPNVFHDSSCQPKVIKQKWQITPPASPYIPKSQQKKKGVDYSACMQEHPYDGNPHDELSFSEMLQSYDDYASVTGNTAKSKQSRVSKSPELSKKKKKKDRRRSFTVANIDAATIEAAKEASRESSRRPSKVRQLAREYSRRIKDKKSKRVSTVFEEPENSVTESSEPQWLKDLRLRKKSRESSQEDQDDLTPPILQHESYITQKYKVGQCTYDDSRRSSTLTKLQSPSQMRKHGCNTKLHRSQSTDFRFHLEDSPDFSELHKSGGLKGWVKSLVIKFGGHKN